MAYPVIGQCPVCHEALEVTQLHCRACDTSISGHFDLGRFYQLTPEQLAFAETFIRCAGRIKRVEKELNISYPTVRSRLVELIRALGYEVEEEPIPPTEQRKEILEQLAAGQINAEDAIKLLKRS